MHELGGLRGRPGREVAPFDERRAQPSRGRVERDAGSGDPAADDDDVEVLLGQPPESDLPVEDGRGSSHQVTGQKACHKPISRAPSGGTEFGGHR